MCGISGEIRFDGRSASPGVVEAMCARLAPRGPDGSGVFARGAAALGHRRLKIIDLSERAAQPMHDPESGLSLVYNGAIYNYKELRAELKKKGWRFFSSGDTEVLLKGYRAWGEGLVARLNGMFAFAVWDPARGRLFCARDRLGIKPFYYADLPGAFRFASTLPALLAPGGVDTELDAAALHHYMTFHSVVPAPRTLLRGVRKLPPATWMVLDARGRKREKRYWSPRFGVRKGERGLGMSEWGRIALKSLRKSVERRLTADVPVGVLLSGGLDSSLITGLLAERGGRRPDTFSIGFEDAGGEKGSEFEYSDVVVRRFKTRHRKLRVSSRGILEDLDECVRAMSEPMASHDNIGFYLLSKEVAKHVKVVQSGQGADEVFAGYHWYPPMAESRRPVPDYARVFFDRTHAEYLGAVAPGYACGDVSRAFVRRRFAEPGASRPLDKALRLDTGVMLVDDPVKRVDNMTMAWGLEARVPFLDHEVVETAARIPGRFKLAQGGKGVLKEAARGVIPAEVIDRPKGYFPVPALKYLRGEVLRSVQEHAAGRDARARGIFRRGYVARLLREPDRHLTPLRGSKLWQIALLNHWLSANGL